MRVSFIMEMINDTGAQLSKKSFFCPTQNLIYLGKLLNLKLNIVLPTCKRIKKTIDLILKAHKEKKVSLKFLESLKGIFIFIKSSKSQYITGEINKKVAKITKAFPKEIITKKDTKEINKVLINIDNRMLNLFHTWNECILDCFTCPEGIKISATLMLQADTSRDAGGSFLVTPEREAFFYTHSIELQSELNEFSSTRGELEALHQGLLKFAEEIKKYPNHQLAIFNDNLANIHNLYKEGSKREELQIFYDNFFMTLNATTKNRSFFWSSREEMYSQLADKLSKKHVPVLTKKWKYWREKYIKKIFWDQENRTVNEFYTLLKFHSNNLMNIREWKGTKATFIFSALFQTENILEILETFKIMKIKGVIFIPKFHEIMILDYIHKLFKNNT